MLGFATIGSAHADVILSSSLQDINSAPSGTVATTTTDSTGRRTTVTGASRVSGTTTVGTWYQANVGGGGTVGITTDYPEGGNGSAFFSTTSGTSKGDLQYYFANNMALSTISSVSYDFFRDAASTTNPNFSPVLRFDIAKNGAFAGSLVLENVYQNQQPAPVGTWTTVSATLNTGIFWATNAALGPTFADANGGQKTLQAWIDANAGTTLSVYGVNIGVGSGWNGTFSGALDNVAVAFAGGPTLTANFEVAAATAVPEPASLLLTAVGLAVVGQLRRRRSV